jgi:hypothetical protein
MHKFKVGQLVNPRLASKDDITQVYEVARQMPEDVTGTPQYRIKGLRTGLERFVREAEITLYAPPSRDVSGRY